MESRLARTARTLIVVAILAAALSPAVLAPKPALACSCAAAPNPADLSFSDTVFSGTAVEVAPWDRAGSSGTLLPVTFAVDHIWLGDAEPLTTVRTAANGASCGYTFEEGMRYLVYGKATDGYVEVNLCSATRPYDHAAVEVLEAVAGSGRAVEGPAAETAGVYPGVSSEPPPSEGDSNQRGFVLVGLAIVAVGVAGAVFALARRRHPI